MRWIYKAMAAQGPTWPLLFLEPFYGGSHKQLVDLLVREFGGDLFTLPATKWHWRSRVAALSLAHTLPTHHNYKVLFCSSVLNLCELVALRPDLSALHKVIYFHENQLVYPVRKQQERDFQYGYNQILSCLVADAVVFNSHFNMSSFLGGIEPHLKLMPDSRPRGLVELIRPKCQVLYFPVELLSQPHTSQATSCFTNYDTGCCTDYDTEGRMRLLKVGEKPDDTRNGSQQEGGQRDLHPLHIVWPHRWEHDKGPEEFCQTLLRLMEANKHFKVSFLGSHTSDIPECISEARSQLGERVAHYGPLSKEHYWQVLEQADIAVSTAKHEFFGVAMMEAVASGCYPLCPNRLVYPEIYPGECLYNTEQQLFKRLSRLCDKPWLLQQTRVKMDPGQFSWCKLKSAYHELLNWSR